MITVLLGLTGALAYGFADFAGGLAARGRRALVVTTLTSTLGILPLLIGLLVLGGRFTADALLWGSVAGVSGSIAVLLLYAALATGPMSVLSPLTSVFAALLPVLVGVALGARLSPLAIGAIIVAIGAVILVSSARNTSGARVTIRGVLAAAISGCGFGGIVLAYDLTSPRDGVGPLVIARVVQAVLITFAMLATRRRAAASTRAAASIRADGSTRADGRARFWWLVLACGVLDATANIFIQAALHSNVADPTTLPTVSVLNALYPIGTIVLASIVLRERLGGLQITGIGLGIAASAVLALS